MDPPQELFRLGARRHQYLGHPNFFEFHEHLRMVVVVLAGHGAIHLNPLHDVLAAEGFEQQ